MTPHFETAEWEWPTQEPPLLDSDIAEYDPTKHGRYYDPTIETERDQENEHDDRITYGSLLEQARRGEISLLDPHQPVPAFEDLRIGDTSWYTEPRHCMPKPGLILRFWAEGKIQQKPPKDDTERGLVRYAGDGGHFWMPHLHPFEETDENGLPVIRDQERSDFCVTVIAFCQNENDLSGEAIPRIAVASITPIRGLPDENFLGQPPGSYPFTEFEALSESGEPLPLRTGEIVRPRHDGPKTIDFLPLEETPSIAMWEGKYKRTLGAHGAVLVPMTVLRNPENHAITIAIGWH